MTRSQSSAKPKTKGDTKKASLAKQREKQRRQAVNPSRASSRLVVLGLDLSLTGTGVAAWDGERVLLKRLFKTEGLGPKGDKRPGLLPSGKFRGTEEERIDWIKRRIVKCVKKIQPDLVIIEGHSFKSAGRKSYTGVHELHGVVKNKLFLLGQEFRCEPPSSVKKDFAGHGQASKEQMVDRAQDFDPSIVDENVADAFACAWYGNAEKLGA